MTMKKYIFTILIILAIIACNDDFENILVPRLLKKCFETYDNFKAFMFPCYGMFTNTTIATSVTNGYAQNAQYRGDVNAGYLTTRYNYNPYAFQTIQNVSSVTGGILDIYDG